MPAAEIRGITLVDLPTIRRLCGQNIILHNELGFTRDVCGTNSPTVSNIIFPRSLYTYMMKVGDQPVVGQLQHVPENDNAYLVYLATEAPSETSDDVWFHVLDALAREAGKQHSHHLIAEVAISHPMYEVMRQCGYAVYSRQTIWRHEPVSTMPEDEGLPVTKVVAEDWWGIQALFSNTIPPMLQRVMIPPDDMQGFVYRKQQQVEAYIAISEGRLGVYLVPYVHPDAMDEFIPLLRTVITQTKQAYKVPIYVCIRGYQSWLENRMVDHDFVPGLEQALMVKHMAAGVQKTSFQPVQVKGKLDTVPPTSSISIYTDNYRYTEEDEVIYEQTNHG